MRPRHHYGAVHLNLAQSAHCGADEYYIQSVDDGQYLTVKEGPSPTYRHHVSHHRDVNIPLKLLHFQKEQSEATVFRIKKYESSLSSWRTQLKIGSKVFVRDSRISQRICHGNGWYKGNVIGIKDSDVSEYGKMINVKYSGIAIDCSGLRKVCRVSGELWVPIESEDISLFTKDEKSEYYRRILREEDFSPDCFKTAEEMEAEWKEIEENLRGEIGDDVVKQTRPDGAQDIEYEQKRKIMKSKSFIQHRNGRKEKKKKKWIYKGLKSDIKRLERKSRKYGLIQKYEWYL